jgi:hypothetical protein
MKKRFGGFFTKFIWFILIFLAAVGVSVAVAQLFAPQPIANVPSIVRPAPLQPIANSPTPTETPALNTSEAATSQTPQPQPTADNSTTNTPTTATPESTPTPATNSNTSALPALEQPDKVTLVAPRKLTKGAVLRIFENVDNSNRPDPINYSPTSTKNVAGLSLVSVNQSQFQEVSGYLLAERTANYAFVITFPDNANLDANYLRLRIDGQPLANVKGGTVNLEKGWHQVSLFYFEPYNNNVANQIQVKWGLEGTDLKRLQVWREAA